MKKALIVYASKTGTTQDVANSLAAALSPFCDTYDCRRRVKATEYTLETVNANALQWRDYEAVVLGSAMYMGKPMKELKQFCKDQETELLAKKLILFTCGIGTWEEDKGYMWQNLPKSITQQALFYLHLGGEIRKDRMGLLARIAMHEYEKEHGVALGINQTQVEKMINMVRSYL